MPTYRITGPDGKTYQVTAPEGATEAQVLAYVQSNAAKPKTAEDLTPGLSVNPTEGLSGLELFGAGAGKSLRDTGLGLTQSLAQGGMVGRGLNAAAEWAGIPLPENQIERWATNAINQNQAADAALMDTNSGFAGNVTGLAAQVLAPGGVATAGARVPRLSSVAPQLQAAGRALLPTTVRGGTVQGGLLGSVAPVGEGDSAAGNTGMGLLGGYVGGVLPRLLGAGVRATGRALEPFYEKGMERIAGRTVQRFADNPALPQFPDPVIGTAPTLAEATLDPGIAQLQRAAFSKNPEVANAIFDARVAANEGRAQALSRFAGTPETRQAAMDAITEAETTAYRSMDDIADVNVQPVVRQIDRILAGPEGKRTAVREALTKVRKQFFEPYEDSERIKDARRIVDMTLGGRMSSADDAALREARRILSNRAGASPDEVVELLSGIKASSKTAATAISQAKELVNSLNVAYENQVPRLISARQEIGDILSGQSDLKGGKLAQSELISIRDSLDAAIRKVAPQIDEALDARRIGMRPVNEMDTVTDLLQRATVPVATRAGTIGRRRITCCLLKRRTRLKASASVWPASSSRITRPVRRVRLRLS
jgi:hypothetical protein